MPDYTLHLISGPLRFGASEDDAKRLATELQTHNDEVVRLRAEVDALRENNHGWLRANGPGGWIDALRADAERYRWLRDGSNPPWVMQMLERYADNGSDFDAEVDAARAPQQAEPVAQIGWSDEFGNLFPMAAWKPAQSTHHDSHKTAWRAVYLHPPAAEVQTAPKVIRNDDGNYVIEGSPPAGPLLDALLAQCELEAKLQRLRDAAKDVCEWADAAQWALGNETGVPAAKLDALRRVLEGGE